MHDRYSVFVDGVTVGDGTRFEYSQTEATDVDNSSPYTASVTDTYELNGRTVSVVGDKLYWGEVDVHVPHSRDAETIEVCSQSGRHWTVFEFAPVLAVESDGETTEFLARSLAIRTVQGVGPERQGDAT